jgi:hypothetical protein
MAGAQAIATALTAAIQLMVAAIITAITTTEAPATTTFTAAAGPITPVVFAHTPVQARADVLNCKLLATQRLTTVQPPNSQPLLL